MRKILFLNTVYQKGGAAQVTQDLFHHFKGKGFLVFFAYGRGHHETIANTFYFGNKIEFFIHLFLVRFLGLEGLGSYFATNKLIKFIEKKEINLVHIHNLHGYYLNFFKLLKYLNKKNIKVIWTLHDEWLFTWLPAHSMDCIHCKTLVGKCINRYNYPKNYLPLFSKLMLKRKRQILLFNNITFVCSAEWLYKEAKNKFKVDNSILISNGVNSNIFSPVINKNNLRKKYNLSINKKIILFLINDLKDENKGGQYLLKLAKRLESKPYILGVIGLANLPKFNDLVSFGHISNRNDLAEIYSLSDLYCSVSLVETAPLSVLEAMSCALPIVGFNIKALNNLVTKNNGKLVDYGDDNKLAEIICDIINDKSLLKVKGDYSRKIILNNYNQKIMYDLYEKIYKS